MNSKFSFGNHETSRIQLHVHASLSSHDESHESKRASLSSHDESHESKKTSLSSHHESHESIIESL